MLTPKQLITDVNPYPIDIHVDLNDVVAIESSSCTHRTLWYAIKTVSAAALMKVCGRSQARVNHLVVCVCVGVLCVCVCVNVHDLPMSASCWVAAVSAFVHSSMSGELSFTGNEHMCCVCVCVCECS